MARQTRKKNIQRSKNTRRSNNGRKTKTRNLFRNKKNNKRRTKKFRGGVDKKWLAAATMPLAVQTPWAGNPMAMGINNPNIPLHHGTVHNSLKNTGTVSRNPTLSTAYNIPVRPGDHFGELMSEVHDHRVLSGNLPAPTVPATNSRSWRNWLADRSKPKNNNKNNNNNNNNNIPSLNNKNNNYNNNNNTPNPNNYTDPGDLDHLTNEEGEQYKELMMKRRPRGKVGPLWTKKEGAFFLEMRDKIAKAKAKAGQEAS